MTRTRYRASALGAAISISLGACSPGGPSGAELLGDPLLTEAMPGAVQLYENEIDPAGGVEGATYGFAYRVYGSHEDEEAVLEWHHEFLQSGGARPTERRVIGLRFGDGYPQHAWRDGDRIFSLGFTDSDEIASTLDPTAADYPTIFQVTLVYDPEEDD